jgi:hypothetical protein
MFNGITMLHDGYLDQPYCDVIPSTGRWICTITDNVKPEGSAGEHVAAIWSDDNGKTWTKPVSVEPAPNNTLLANAYSMTIVAPGMGRTEAGAPTERVYSIYNMNTQNVTHDGSGGPPITRVDMLGRFWMRYSDTGGATWSKARYLVPYRLTSIDKHNEFGGNVTIMWTVDQLKVREGVAYFAFTKIGKYLLGPPEEMWLMASANLLSEPDAAKITWRLLPDGDVGIKPIVGFENTHIEEAHVLPLMDYGMYSGSSTSGSSTSASANTSATGSASGLGFYMTGRTTMGWMACSATADATGATGWAPTSRAQYFDPTLSSSSRGTPMQGLVPLGQSKSAFGGVNAGLKNPRGPITMKRIEGLCTTSGVNTVGPEPYLLLYFNNNYKTYLNRDPYWLSIGWEVAPLASGSVGTSVPAVSAVPAVPAILWSQPEVVLYDATDHQDRPGYPDFITHKKAGVVEVFVTETQKTDARLHKVDPSLLSLLCTQHAIGAQTTPAHDPALVLVPTDQGKNVPTPAFPLLSPGASSPGVGGVGLAITLTLTVSSAASSGAASAETVLLSTKIGASNASGSAVPSTESTSGAGAATASTRGLTLVLNANHSTTFWISDGTSSASITTDSVCTARIAEAMAASGTFFVGVSVDAGPRIMTIMVDGVLCDGGGTQSTGWEWFPLLNNVSGLPQMAVLPANADNGPVDLIGGAIYTRMLTTTEMVGNYRTGRK